MKNFDLIAVWGLSIITFMTSNTFIGLCAVIASLTTIIKNIPGVVNSIKNFKKYILNLKTKNND